MVSSIAITIATGVYLWNKDKDKKCYAPNSFEDFKNTGEWFDVATRFKQILKIIFALAITDVGRSVIMILAVALQSRSLANLYQALFFNDVLGFAAIIVLLIFRL